MKRARPAAALKRIGGDLQDRDGHRPPLQGASHPPVWWGRAGKPSHPGHLVESPGQFHAAFRGELCFRDDPDAQRSHQGAIGPLGQKALFAPIRRAGCARHHSRRRRGASTAARQPLDRCPPPARRREQRWNIAIGVAQVKTMPGRTDGGPDEPACGSGRLQHQAGGGGIADGDVVVPGDLAQRAIAQGAPRGDPVENLHPLRPGQFGHVLG